MNKEKGGILKRINIVSGKRILLTDENREDKPYIIGSSGAGKSKRMEDRIRSEIDSGKLE